MTSDLGLAANRMASLLGAKSVAIIGASERSKYANSVTDNLLAFGLDADSLHFVNPGRDRFRSYTCHGSVKDIGEDIDLAVLVTAGHRVPEVIAECGLAGVRAAVVLASGFAEDGGEGARLQQVVADVAREHDVAMLGPNTLGFLSTGTGVAAWGGRLPEGFRPGGLSTVFQSSGMLNLFLQMVATQRLGVDIAISTGNQVDVDLGDALLSAVTSEQTDYVAVHIESIRSPTKVIRALWLAAEAGKPVVVLRAGRSEVGQRNVAAHTGKLAPSDVAWDSVLDQFGAIPVDDVEEMVQVCVLLAAGIGRRRSAAAPASAGRVGFITISGGDCTLLADIAERVGADLPDLGAADRAGLDQALGRTGLLGNPLDLGTATRENPEGFRQAVRLVAGNPAIDVVAARLYMPEGVPDDAAASYGVVAEEVRRAGKQLVAVSRTVDEATVEWREFFRKTGVPLLRGYTGALRALAKVGGFARKDASGSIAKLRDLPALADPARDDDSRQETHILGGAETLALLDEYGVAYPRTSVVTTWEDARDSARGMGYPLVLKADNATIAHKTEAGAVVVGIADEAALEAAWRQVSSAARSEAPELSAPPALLLQKMVSGAVGEVLIGLTTLDGVGPVLVVASGGIFTELIGDVAMRLCPIDEDDARSMLDELAVSKVLAGWRGGSPGDVASLVAAMVAVSRLGRQHRHLVREIDLNPVLVLPDGQGVVAVDALISIRDMAVIAGQPEAGRPKQVSGPQRSQGVTTA